MGIDGQHHYRLQIGNYRLLKKISTGTSGIVYQGQHNVSKILPTDKNATQKIRIG